MGHNGVERGAQKVRPNSGTQSFVKIDNRDFSVPRGLSSSSAECRQKISTCLNNNKFNKLIMKKIKIVATTSHIFRL